MTATPSSLPIACSLTAEGAGDRQADWHALVSRALVSRTSIRDGVRIELQNSPSVQREIERLVAAEQACCPFMTMSVDKSDRELLVLTITAQESATPILEQMLAGGR